MSEFDDSHWAQSRFSQEFRQSADDFIPERHRMIEIAKALYRYFCQGCDTRILDLGCGDGLVTHELMSIDSSIDATLVDGSMEMLHAAKSCLAQFSKVRYVNASFQDLLAEDPLETTFHFTLSSLAIHHLNMDEKESLFKYVYDHLDSDGLFLNIDVVLSPGDDLENWYLSLWKEWISTHVIGPEKSNLLTIPDRYKNNQHDRPDTLLAQMEAMNTLGFKDVDCYYKYGLFAMFGGRK